MDTNFSIEPYENFSTYSNIDFVPLESPHTMHPVDQGLNAENAYSRDAIMDRNTKDSMEADYLMNRPMPDAASRILRETTGYREVYGFNDNMLPDTVDKLEVDQLDTTQLPYRPEPRCAMKKTPVKDVSEVKEHFGASSTTSKCTPRKFTKSFVKVVIWFFVVLLIIALIYLTLKRYMLVGKAIDSDDKETASILLTPELSMGLTTLLAAL